MRKHSLEVTFAFNLLWPLCTIFRIRKAHSFHAAPVLCFKWLWWSTIPPFGEIQRTIVWKSSDQPSVILILWDWVEWEPVVLNWNLRWFIQKGGPIFSSKIFFYKLIGGMKNCLLKGFCKMTGNCLWGLRISPLIMCEIQRVGSRLMFWFRWQLSC